VFVLVVVFVVVIVLIVIFLVLSIPNLPHPAVGAHGRGR
jgi:hypothetical protein